MKIYVNFPKPDTVAEFLIKFFSVVSGGVEYKSVETFHDEACTMQQCPASKYRSFDELLICVQTYFPEITDVELLRQCLILNHPETNQYSKEKGLMFYMCRCSDIKRIVCMYYHNYGDPFCDTNYDSAWKWTDLLRQLGIESPEQLSEYIKNNKTPNPQLEISKAEPLEESIQF